MRKKILPLILAMSLVFSLSGCSNGTTNNSTTEIVITSENETETNIETDTKSNNEKDVSLKELPLPELDEGMRGQLGIDKNINEATIDEYLHRSDAVYRDVRMLIDEGNYEAIGGDSYLSGYVDGFEVVPLPYLCNVMGLPEEVGQTYSGVTLFTVDENGNYTANYEESEQILNDLFPKDKTIFLMCGGGGYAGMTKNLLVANGWDANKIYDVGGYWYYEGENSIDVKRVVGDNTYYDFYKVPYHDIDFDTLHSLNKETYSPTIDENLTISDVSVDKMPELNSIDELNEKIESGDTFILYVYLPGCVSCAGFKPIINEYNDSDQVTIYQMSYSLLKDNDNIVTSHTKYTPSVFIFKDKEMLAYLDPSSDKDLQFYKTTENFSGWVAAFLDTETIKSQTVNNDTGCEDECTD